MNPQTNAGRRKRSSSVQKEEPTKKRIEESKEEGDDSSDSDEKVSSHSPRGWDDIGDKEEMYLAGTREELYEMIMRKEGYMHKAKEKSTVELIQLLRSLLTYSRENIEELQIAQPEEEEASPEERSQIGKFTALIGFQHRRIVWLVNTLIERYRRRCRKSNDQVRIIEELKKENALLWESKEDITKERDELLGRVNSRRVDVEKKDVGISTETATPDVEMVEDSTSAPQGIPQNLVRTLEAMIERKIGELLSRVGLSVEKKRKDSFPPPITRGKTSGTIAPGDGTTTPRSDRLWSEVVAKDAGKPQSVRDSTPVKGGGRAGARENPGPARKEKGGKGRKKREWPKPLQSAAVVLTAPAGKESSCTELMRRARKEIAIEDLDIPYLDIRRPRTGGYILGVPGQNQESKADSLASGLGRLAEGTGVRVTRPMKTADIRVSGMDETATPEEVVAAVSELTGCRSDRVKCGRIQRTIAGVGSMWLQCPVDAAVKAARTGRTKVGWANVSIEMLKARPLRCFRCLEVGHIGVQCTSKEDRTHRCYRCGTVGH